ncbi:MAG TPA: FCD domain-containing protein [Candidatus Dormibacteraeota bacterium]|jgi:DNA-binding FadR family transcriptional regulator|nr:FCD domain-containing protein [Candidatus Dormibacteraeota bacterium]
MTRVPRTSASPRRTPSTVVTRRGDKVSEVVARDIVHRIVHQGLQPGTSLPAESAMLRDYDVGRASLREALRLLEVHGLLSIRPGPRGGPVVDALSSADFGRMATLYFQTIGATFRELVEARLVMEPVMARLAAERRDPEMLRALAESIAESDTLGEGDDVDYARVSTDFHGLIAGMSSNRVLDLFGRAIKDVYTDRVTGTLYPPSARQRVHDAHVAIAQAIRRGEATRAERLMREHMVEFVEYVEKRHPGLMDEVVDWR